RLQISDVGVWVVAADYEPLAVGTVDGAHSRRVIAAQPVAVRGSEAVGGPVLWRASPLRRPALDRTVHWSAVLRILLLRISLLGNPLLRSPMLRRSRGRL